MAETRIGGPAPGDGTAGERPLRRPARLRWQLVLLLIPFVALLYPPWYAHATPRLWGIPFFIWYQFAWVIGGVLVTAIVYAIDWGLAHDSR